MGWASGSYLAEDIWEKIRDFIPQDEQKHAAKIIYDSFCDEDADDWTNEKGSLEDIASNVTYEKNNCYFCTNKKKICKCGSCVEHCDCINEDYNDESEQ